MSGKDEPCDADKTPVTIVTGFLGAGKTTLVNYILQGEHGKKIAVIENEFGEVNIDEALVSENLQYKEDVISMDNGCVCCTVRGDLIKALTTLMKRGKKFDHVLIETTGLADPAPVAFTFFINQEVADFYRIDSILCLADAKHIREHLNEVKPDDAVNEAVQQVAFADRILLNKTDLVTKEELHAVREELASINAYAEVIETVQSRVDLDRVLGVSSFSVEKTLQVDPYFLEEDEAAAAAECTEPGCTDEAHGHAHGGHGHAHAGEACDKADCAEPAHGHGHGHKEEHGHGHGHEAKKAKIAPRKKRHDLSGVSSVGIEAEGELDFNGLNGFMMRLLQERARDIYRSKGVLCFAGQGDAKFVFQGVHEQIHFGPSSATWAPGEKRINKMVFIGRKLDREALETGFKACLVAPK